MKQSQDKEETPKNIKRTVKKIAIFGTFRNFFYRFLEYLRKHGQTL